MSVRPLRHTLSDTLIKKVGNHESVLVLSQCKDASTRQDHNSLIDFALSVALFYKNALCWGGFWRKERERFGKNLLRNAWKEGILKMFLYKVLAGNRLEWSTNCVQAFLFSFFHKVQKKESLSSCDFAILFESINSHKELRKKKNQQDF